MFIHHRCRRCRHRRSCCFFCRAYLFFSLLSTLNLFTAKKRTTTRIPNYELLYSFRILWSSYLAYLMCMCRCLFVYHSNYSFNFPFCGRICFLCVCICVYYMRDANYLKSHLSLFYFFFTRSRTKLWSHAVLNTRAYTYTYVYIVHKIYTHTHTNGELSTAWDIRVTVCGINSHVYDMNRINSTHLLTLTSMKCACIHSNNVCRCI